MNVRTQSLPADVLIHDRNVDVFPLHRTLVDLLTIHDQFPVQFLFFRLQYHLGALYSDGAFGVRLDSLRLRLTLGIEGLPILVLIRPTLLALSLSMLTTKRRYCPR